MRKLALLSIIPLVFATGCVRTAPRYAAIPAEEVVVVPAPVSTRPVVRVYPEAPVGTTTTAVLPPGVSATEHAIAQSIRHMFNDDPGWAGLTDRVEVRVSGNTVHLRGTVASDSIRDRIEQKIRGVSGVTLIDNGLRVVTP